MTWPSQPLGEVASIERVGVSPESLPTDSFYLGLEHIERGGRVLGRQTVGEAGLASIKFTFDEGHVLFGKLRPNLGKVARPDFSGVCSTDILPIRPGDALDRNFLHHYLAQPSMVKFAASRTSGANLPRLNPSVLATFNVPMPPLDEQRRIAAILDQADALRKNRRHAISHLDSLARSVFDACLTNASIEWLALGTVTTFFGGASLPAGEAFSGQEGGSLLMKVSDMNRLGNENVISATTLWTSDRGGRASTVEADAVVLPKRGASIGTNKKRITSRRTVLDPNIMGIQPDSNKILCAYLHAWFRSFDLSTITSGSTVPQLNKQDLSPLLIPVPDMDQQREFAACIASIALSRSAMDASLADLDGMFSSLQHRAFSGQL